MGKRGRKPEEKVPIHWSANFAYGLGLLATDGNLSPNRRHISFTSKDREQVDNFQQALGIQTNIGKKSSGLDPEKKYFVVQFSDVAFYQFLERKGITPAKSRTLGSIRVPKNLFFHFLRGCFDGDGYSYSYRDKRWKSSFLFYLCFCSASTKHLYWLQVEIEGLLNIKGSIKLSRTSGCHELRYAKTEAKLIVRELYKKEGCLCLSRKRLKIEESLGMMCKQDRKKTES